MIEQHETAAGSNHPAERLLGFATAALRRRHEAKARVLLANWLAETGQGYQGDIQSKQTSQAPSTRLRCSWCGGLTTVAAQSWQETMNASVMFYIVRDASPLGWLKT